MLAMLWLGMMVISVLVGLYTGNLSAVAQAVTDYIEITVKIGLTLAGVIVFWTGIMRIAQEAGLITQLSRLLMPILSRLFPDVPKDNPAMGMIVLNIAANMLGIGNAATPFGLQAMEHLNKINRFPGTASNAMCMLLAINTSSIQLIQVTAIGFLVAAGATHPTDIVITGLLATACSTIAAIVAVKVLQNLPWFRLPNEPAPTVIDETTDLQKPVEENNS